MVVPGSFLLCFYVVCFFLFTSLFLLVFLFVCVLRFFPGFVCFINLWVPSCPLCLLLLCVHVCAIAIVLVYVVFVDMS